MSPFSVDLITTACIAGCGVILALAALTVR